MEQQAPDPTLFLLQGLSAAEQEQYRTAIGEAPQSYRRGAVIYDRSRARRALAWVLDGHLRVLHGRVVMNDLHPGDVFGAAALFGGDGYVSRIRAVTACAVLLLPEELLRQWFRRCPQMAVNYIGFLSSRVRFLNGKIAIFTQDSAQHRLYRWLRANCDEWGRLPERLSMTKLAGTLSMGRTSLYRAMEELAEAGLIVRDGKRIEVIL